MVDEKWKYKRFHYTSFESPFVVVSKKEEFHCAFMVIITIVAITRVFHVTDRSNGKP